MKSHWRHHEIKTKMFHISFSLISKPKNSVYNVHDCTVYTMPNESDTNKPNKLNKTKPKQTSKKEEERKMRTNKR